MEVKVIESDDRGGLDANTKSFFMDMEGMEVGAIVERVEYYPDERSGVSRVILSGDEMFWILEFKVYHQKPWIFPNTLWYHIEDMAKEVIAGLFS